MTNFSKSFARKAVLVSASLFLALPVLGQTTSSTNNESKVEAKVSKKDKKDAKKDKQSGNPTLANLQGGGSGWRLQAGVTHTPRLRKDQEDTTDILLRGDYNINKKHTIRVQQFMTKFYGKYSSENEFKPFDTSIGHFYRLGYKPMGIGLQLRNQLSLPISNESARDDLFTTYQASVVGSKSLLGGKLLAFGIPYGRYFFYEFKTGPGREGRLLPRLQYGLSLGALYFATSKLALYAGGDYRNDTVYTVAAGDSQIPRGTYRFDLDATYQWTGHLSTSVSFNQGRASYIQGGRYELVLFDDQASRVNFGLTYIY